MTEPSDTEERRVDPLASAEWSKLREAHPEFYCAALAHVDVAQGKRHLEPKVQVFVALVVDAAVTHLHGAGLRRHIAAALAAGASSAEILEVLECASTVSVHAMNFGVPVLLDVLEQRGERSGPLPLDERRRRLKEDFRDRRGYWNSTWDEMLEVAPDYFESYTAVSSVPWEAGHLPPLVKELLYIAFDVSVTHLYRVGLRLHIENALDLGASPEQVVEVMEIASVIGLRAAGEGVVALAEQTRHADLT